ncbi:MAG: hypothetical protein ACT4N2_06015 [Hyphomicrobium sp.]
MDVFGLLSQLGASDVLDGATIEIVKQIARLWWAGPLESLNQLRSTLDPIIWIVSVILALVTGTFAIYKWWNF